MWINLQSGPVFAYTANKTFQANLPTLVFIHGVLNDHSVWQTQSRYMAYHGWNVLAIDLPGQGKSQGQAPTSVELASQVIIEILDQFQIEKASLVGHSFGSLIALETASQIPQRIQHLVLVGTAYPMKVSTALLEASVNNPEKAIALVNQFSHSRLALTANNQASGVWSYGAANALMRKTLKSNATTNVFYTGFKACDSYSNGENAASKVQAKTSFILGNQDQMTPAKAAQSLIDKIPNAQVFRVDAGHSLMSEAPIEVLKALKQALL